MCIIYLINSQYVMLSKSKHKFKGFASSYVTLIYIIIYFVSAPSSIPSYLCLSLLLASMPQNARPNLSLHVTELSMLLKKKVLSNQLPLNIVSLTSSFFASLSNYDPLILFQLPCHLRIGK